MENRLIEERLSRYMRGESSADEAAAVEKWLEKHIADRCYDEMFDRLLESTPADSDTETVGRIRRRLEMLIEADKPAARKPLRRMLRIAGYAAAAVAAAVVLFIGLRPSHPAEWIEAYAGSGETLDITLPDNSRIWLNSGSRIFYPERFDAKTRRVYIDGHILADVTSDKRHPFVVSAPGVEVRVLGTRFSVKSYAQHPNIEVALIEGSVAMQAGTNGKEVDYKLIPGDMVRYNRSDSTVETYRIDADTYASWHTGKTISFVNQTLYDIANDLERLFGVNIVIDSPQLATTTYYASFVNNESLDQILRALNSNNTMLISRINDTVIITSN